MVTNYIYWLGEGQLSRVSCPAGNYSGLIVWEMKCWRQFYGARLSGGSFSVKNHSRVIVRGTKVREVISWEDCPGGSYPGENCHWPHIKKDNNVLQKKYYRDYKGRGRFLYNNQCLSLSWYFQKSNNANISNAAALFLFRIIL